MEVKSGFHPIKVTDLNKCLILWKWQYSIIQTSSQPRPPHVEPVKEVGEVSSISFLLIVVIL